jgi:hypothetical protein
MTIAQWTGRVLLACAACAVGVAPPSVLAQDRTPDSAEVRTAATARRGVRPDRARLTLQFTAEGRTPQQAGERLAARADTLRVALARSGVPRDSLVMGSQWYWWPQRVEVITRPRRVAYGRGSQQASDTVSLPDGGWYEVPLFDTTYRAREVIEVRLGDPAKVGPVIDAALGLRITDISGIRFEAADVREAQLAALREATASAIEQAEAIAAASGGRLGRVLLLSSQPEFRERHWEGFALSGASAAGNPTVITAPAVDVTVTVSGRWRLIGR